MSRASIRSTIARPSRRVVTRCGVRLQNEVIAVGNETEIGHDQLKKLTKEAKADG